MILSGTPPFVSVIVPVYKDWIRLNKCLQALGEQTYPDECYEIVVVDNEEVGLSRGELVAGGARLILLHESTPGSDAARNTGMVAAKGTILAFTDSDCVPDPRWLENGVSFLLSHRDYGYIGGKIDLDFRGGGLSVAEVFEKAFAFRQEEIEKGRTFAVTANLMAWREVFNVVGPFNGSLITGGDCEWGNRATVSGYRGGYCETARVNHPARSTLGELFRKRLRVSSGQYQLAGRARKRIAIIVVGLLPPLVQIWKLRDRNDLTLLEKTIAVVVMYAMRITRSVSFLLIALSIMRLRRA